MAATDGGRYMPQDLYNLCVATAAMSKAAKADHAHVHAMVSSYLRDYPSEGQSLAREIDVCAEELLRMAPAFLRSFGEMTDRQLQEDMVGFVVTVMNELKRVQQWQQKQRPFWKRILGGTRFNYSTTPIPDRQKACVETLRLVLETLRMQIRMDALKRAPSIEDLLRKDGLLP